MEEPSAGSGYQAREIQGIECPHYIILSVYIASPSAAKQSLSTWHEKHS